MENNIHTKIFDKLLNNTENLDSVEKTTIVSIYAMVTLYGMIHLVFLIFFLSQKIPEMVFVNSTSIVICLITLYVLADLKNITTGLLLWVANSCYYILAMTYILGYNKNSIVFLPVLLLLIHIVFPNKKKYLFFNTHLVIMTYFVNLLIKYNVEAKYNHLFDFIDVINTSCALVLAALIIYFKTTTDDLIKKHTSKQLDGLVEEVDALTTEASIDFLTGLWNRRYVEKQLETEDLTNAYIILADIDYFKQINDTYGHLCGDYVLKEVAQLFKTAFRNDDIVCRWGGEEFLIFLKNVKYLNVCEKLERLRIQIQEKEFEYNEIKFKVTATLGYILVDKDITIKENIEKADDALYYGKNNGRNRVCGCEELKNNNKN